MARKYKSLADLQADVERMLDNALLYAGPVPQLADDAKTLKVRPLGYKYAGPCALLSDWIPFILFVRFCMFIDLLWR